MGLRAAVHPAFPDSVPSFPAHVPTMSKQRIIRSIIAIIVLLAAAAYIAYQDAPKDRQRATPRPTATPAAGFDYYLASLSWSPTWCESNPDDREQCGRRGYGFILHGLWPQYDSGNGPQDCRSNEEPDQQTIARTLAFMPSRSLIDHEWRTHGSCSGLAPGAYFDLADRAFAALRIPPPLTATARPPAMTAEDVRSAFVDANPGLQATMLGVSCHGNSLAEVRICLDVDLQPRQCGRGVGMRCPRKAVLRIPLIR